MRRIWIVLLGVAVALSSCTASEDSPDPTTSVPASTSATNTQDNQPAVFTQQFHPCEVFSPEQLAQAGLGRKTRSDTELSESVKACGFSHQDKELFPGTFLLATDPLNRKKILEFGLEPVFLTNSTVEGIYTHSMQGKSNQCVASFDFEWGRFSVDYIEIGSERKTDGICSTPVNVLEFLLIHYGRVHGN